METTVWACKACGECGPDETCACGGTRAVVPEMVARRRFMESHEPPSGWRDAEEFEGVWRAHGWPAPPWNKG